MLEMADPMIAFNKFQQQLDSGMIGDYRELNENYFAMCDVRPSGKRYIYAKIIDGKFQAISIFGQEDPINSVECYNVGYAVKEDLRRRGLAGEAVNKGIEDLKKVLSQSKTKTFYVDAIISKTNISSLKVADKLFSRPGVPMIDSESGTPSLYFRKLITI